MESLSIDPMVTAKFSPTDGIIPITASIPTPPLLSQDSVPIPASVSEPFHMFVYPRTHGHDPSNPPGSLRTLAQSQPVLPWPP